MLGAPTALLALVTVAAGGYAIVPGNPVFWCGRVGAFPGIYIIVGAALLQSALYVADASRAYRVTQYAAIPFVLWAGAQLASAYPRTATGSLLLVAVLLGLFRLMRRQFGSHDLAARIALSVVGFVGLTAAATQFVLFNPTHLLSGWFIALCMPVALGVVVGIVGRAPPASAPEVPFLQRCLPVTLLLLPLLRAKIADTAFDTFLYKGTQPYTIADWRTGLSAIVDPFLIGTNFQELINANLIIWLGDYTPSLLAAFCYVILFFVTPYAIGSDDALSRAGRGIVAFAGLSIFVLTEAAIDQGTSYQEPTMLLMLTSSLAPTIAWPAFLAMAVGVKINAGFVGPLVAFFHWSRQGAAGLWWQPAIVGGILALMVLAPQLERNVALSGRLLGLNEILAGTTDPRAPTQILASGATRYDGGVRGGILNNLLLSTCNMALLNDVCPTAYQGSDNAGFHIFPASRAPLFALVLGVALMVALPRPRTQRVRLIASIVTYLFCWLATLKFLSEGRYFLPTSFGFGVLVLINRSAVEAFIAGMPTGVRVSAAVLVVAAVLMIGSDLVPGVFANVGWACERPMFGRVQTQPVRTPATPVEKFVAGYVDEYKHYCPPPGLPPILLAQPDQLNSPYLGGEVISHYYGQDLNARFYAADLRRQQRLASAALAVVFVDPLWKTKMLGIAEKDFKQCFVSKDMIVLCSQLLAPARGQCSQSLYPKR